MSFGHYLHNLKKTQASTMPVQKSRFVMHPLNVPETLPIWSGQHGFPDHLEDYKYVGPTAEMVPKEITPGVDRRLAIVAQLERTYKSGDVTVQEHMTASVSDLKAYHAQMLREGKSEQANKVALLTEQVVNGVPVDPAKGVKERSGLASYYKKAIAPAQQEAVVIKENDLVDEQGRFKSLGQAQKQEAPAVARNQAKADFADPGRSLFLKLNSPG